jgi:hypothetical protein
MGDTQPEVLRELVKPKNGRLIFDDSGRNQIEYRGSLLRRPL